MQDGKVISITVLLNRKVQLTIKDSIKLIPGPLGKLALDFKVETQKDHFPHYFNPVELHGKLDWEGALPPYEYFEPKRTSLSDYEILAQEFKDKRWSFLEVSKKYIQGDVTSLYQILISFFTELKGKFQINPLRSLSAPGLAFTTWKTEQLPFLHEKNLEVYDLSRTSDPLFREAYLGGIVDVYRPHLIGQGFYYDVNSLYPTAMCKPMPVVAPIRVSLSIQKFMDGEFFGYLRATVKAPDELNIGLLPIRHNGRLICPGGIFDGLFFSEELRFALNQGYRIIDIREAFGFQRGGNTFRDLIFKLNQMKIDAQVQEKPTLRNIAKLLMNSMYGRFGIHTEAIHNAIVSPEQATNIAKSHKVHNILPIGGLELISYSLDSPISDVRVKPTLREVIRELPGQTNVPIAAAITAYSRIIINNLKLSAMAAGLEIYYSDTDSLVTNGQMPQELCDSAELGKLKLEHKIMEGYFVAPKMYYLVLEDGTTVAKCKGYSGKLNKDQYLSLLEGKGLDLIVTRWSRDLKEGTVQIRKGLNYRLNPVFLKRDKVLDSKGAWINTAPIILNT